MTNKIVKRVVAGAECTLAVKTNDGYKKVAGQEFTEVLRTSQLLDVATKNEQGKAQRIALATETIINCDGFYVVGDKAFEALEEAFATLSDIGVQIRVGDLYTLTGDVIVEELPLIFDNQEAKVKIKLTANGTLEKAYI